MAEQREVGRRDGGGVQVRAVRAGGWTKARRALFLGELAQTANVRLAVKAAGLSEAAAYALRKRDAGFAIAWGEALCEGYGRLEMLMLERAIADMAGDDVPMIEGSARTRMSERTMLTLLAQHRQTVRELREAQRRDPAASTDPDSDAAIRARILATLDEMHERLIAGDPGDDDA